MFFGDTDSVVGEREIIIFAIFEIAVYRDFCSYTGLGYGVVCKISENGVQ